MDQAPNERAIDKKNIVRERIFQLESWLRDQGQAKDLKHAHFVDINRDSAYWNCGYLAALEHVLELLSDESDSLP
jgi:hypothetical protein